MLEENIFERKTLTKNEYYDNQDDQSSYDSLSFDYEEDEVYDHQIRIFTNEEYKQRYDEHKRAMSRITNKNRSKKLQLKFYTYKRRMIDEVKLENKQNENKQNENKEDDNQETNILSSKLNYLDPDNKQISVSDNVVYCNDNSFPSLSLDNVTKPNININNNNDECDWKEVNNKKHKNKVINEESKTSNIHLHKGKTHNDSTIYYCKYNECFKVKKVKSDTYANNNSNNKCVFLHNSESILSYNNRMKVASEKKHNIKVIEINDKKVTVNKKIVERINENVLENEKVKEKVIAKERPNVWTNFNVTSNNEFITKNEQNNEVVKENDSKEWKKVVHKTKNKGIEEKLNTDTKSNTRTRMCKNKSSCNRKDCNYAHRFDELIFKDCLYKDRCRLIILKNNVYENSFKESSSDFKCCLFKHNNETKNNLFNRLGKFI